MPKRPNWQTTCEGFVCKVCWINFSATDEAMKPRVAPQCGHSFCLGCFVGVRKGLQTSCPTCRRATTIPPEKFAINYSLIDVMNSMNEAKDRQRPAKTKKGEGILVQCFENQNHEADLFCTACNEAYCEQCFMKAHQKGRFMQTHKAVKIGDKPVVTSMCPRHPSREALFYCPMWNCSKYKEVGCAECKHAFHNNHQVLRILNMININLADIKTCHEKLVEKKMVLTSHLEDITESVESFGSEAIAQHEQLISEHFGKNEDENALKKYRIFVSYEKKILECQKKDIKLQINQIEILDKKLMKKWIKKVDLHEPELIYEAKKNLEKGINKNKAYFKLEDYTLHADMSTRPSRPVKVATSTSGQSNSSNHPA